MVQSEIFGRVFRIVFGSNAGTTFTIEQDGTQFLVTAKHIFEDAQFPAQAEIMLWKEGRYQSIHVEIRYPEDQEIDIAVMKTNPYLFVSKINDNKNTSEGLIWGQDVYFLGFPYDFDVHLKSLPDSKTPVPFIKKACLSGALNEHSILVLDGQNNKGFSGGPVCFKSIQSDEKSMRIAGVISGYYYEKKKVLDPTGNITEYYLEDNTGIVKAYDIREAITVAKTWLL